jgi:DNA-binding CsgD family transcriptional regulator
MANAEVIAKKQAHEQETGSKMKPKDAKKISQQSLSKYRNEVGSVSRRERSIKITDKEWEAIQAGAISENKLKKILDNTDIDNLRERATPRTTTTLNKAKVDRIKALSNSNYTLNEIANKLGVSTSTVSKYLKGVA